MPSETQNQKFHFRRYYLWLSLILLSTFFRPSLLPSALASVSGARSTCWKGMATTTLVRNRRGKRRPPRTSNCRAAYGAIPYGDRLNCWKPLKPCVPQHGDETSPDVTVAKAEKNAWMAHGASLNARTMGNQQRSPEQGNVQRLSFAGVGPSGPKRSAPHRAGEDIACAHVKAWGVRLFGDGAAPAQHPGVNKTDEAAHGGRRRRFDRRHPCSPAFSTFWIMPKTNTTRRALSETGGRGKGGINF